MIAAFQRRPLIVSLVAAAAVLVAVIGIELGLGTTLGSALDPAATKRASAAESKLLPPVIATAPEQAYPETAARPLFVPTRRPAPEAAVAQKGNFVPGQFVLQGVTIAGGTRIAMLKEKSSGRVHRVEQGQEVNGIKVAEIQPEVVTLAQAGEREVLALQVQRPAGAPPAAAQTGPFVSGGPAAPAVAATPAQAAPGTPQAPTASAPAAAQAVTPMARPQGVFPTVPPPTAAQGTPGTADVPQASARPPGAAPMSPEELLARRRARRTQQNQ